MAVSLFFLYRNERESTTVTETNTVTDVSNESTDDLHTWVVYWDFDSKDVESLQSYESISLFAVVFDENDQLYVPEDLEQMQNQMEYSGHTYLSIVNDVVYADGSSSQKDVDLLNRILLDEQKREELIDAILEQVQAWNCDGIELDFENIKDASLRNSYMQFIEEIMESASDLDVRVILDSSFPMEQITLPEGPTYVVMCYNLYGTHSGPGPKADISFLQDVAINFKGFQI